jgi:hypothetical protein
MKKLVIYIPENDLAYMDGDEVRQSGVSSTEVFGALHAAIIQAETVLKIKIENAIIREHNEENDNG